MQIGWGRKRYKYSLHIQYVTDITKKYSSTRTFTAFFGCYFFFKFIFFVVLSFVQQAVRAAPTSSGVLQLRPPPDAAAPIFIASLRHGHEVGGDAASEVKTIRAAAIGPRLRFRPPRVAQLASPLAGRRRHSVTHDSVKRERRLL